MEVGCQGDVDTTTGDLFDSVAAVEGNYRRDDFREDHEVSLVGYVDDPHMANGCGGYWIIKNSWGTGCGVNVSGYYYIPYNNIEVHSDISAITGCSVLHGCDEVGDLDRRRLARLNLDDRRGNCLPKLVRRRGVGQSGNGGHLRHDGQQQNHRRSSTPSLPTN